MMQSNYLRVISHVKHKTILILTVFFLIAMVGDVTDLQ